MGLHLRVFLRVGGIRQGCRYSRILERILERRGHNSGSNSGQFWNPNSGVLSGVRILGEISECNMDKLRSHNFEVIMLTESIILAIANVSSSLRGHNF